MWKRKRKKQESEAPEEEPSNDEQTGEVADEKLSTEEQQTDGEEEASSSKELQSSEVVEKSLSTEEGPANNVSEGTSSAKDQPQSGVTIEATPTAEEEHPRGVFIFGRKVEGRFKKVLTALFSIFLFPPIILFSLVIIATVGLLAYPFMLLAICMFFIATPVILPFITIIVLITGKGTVHFGLKNKKFGIKVLGITLPPRADR